MIRIGLHHEDALVRDGLERMLSAEPDMQLVCTTSKIVDLLAHIETEQPDVLILDAVLADVDILDVIARVQSLASLPNLLIVSILIDAAKISEILSAGVLGFYLRCDDPVLIPPTVRAVAAGLPTVSPSLRRLLLDHVKPICKAQERVLDFTNKEREVLRLLAKGLTRKELANALGIADSTVRDYLVRIGSKVGVASREQLIAFAAKYEFDVL
jgi:DNA-binding NarL/FixJ family response regulator